MLPQRTAARTTTASMAALAGEHLSEVTDHLTGRRAARACCGTMQGSAATGHIGSLAKIDINIRLHVSILNLVCIK